MDCEIRRNNVFSRKNYFYPDLPKGYQISQFELPLASGGWVKIEHDGKTKRIGITRLHLEEDAGKSLHDGFPHSGEKTYVDFNRCGTPLAEIVSEPDMRAPDEAYAYLTTLRQILLYTGVSDCNMEEGSLRCDANVNLHVHQADGSKAATPIVEVKNLNSFRFTEQAIEFEVARQWEEFQKTGIKLGDRGGHKATRGYNPDRGETYVLREKEEAADYRYFPDPDLVPVLVTEQQLVGIRSEMCEPPALRRERFQSDFQLTSYDAAVIIDQGRSFADYFETVARACGDGKQAANWITQDVLRETKQRDQLISSFAIRPDVLGALLERINRKQITIKSAREVFGDLLAEADSTSQAPATSRIDEIISAKGLVIVQDTGAIDAAIAAVLGRNPKAISDFKAGKQNAIGALIGQVMKEIKGADPQTVREKIIAAMQ